MNTPTSGGPLVYARTLLKDFRLLAVPAGLDQDQIAFLEARIKILLLSPGPLRDGLVRWALIRSELGAVVGAACMARDLYRDERDQDKTFDRDPVTGGPGRPLYLFAGYFLPKGEPVPAYEELDLRRFARLYDYVKAEGIWEQLPGDNRPAYRATLPDPLPWAGHASAGPTERVGTAHLKLGQVSLWPDSPANRRALWNEVRTMDSPPLLYLGMDAPADVQQASQALGGMEMPVAATVVRLSVQAAVPPHEVPDPYKPLQDEPPAVEGDQALLASQRRHAESRDEQLFHPDARKAAGAAVGFVVGAFINWATAMGGALVGWIAVSKFDARARSGTRPPPPRPMSYRTRAAADSSRNTSDRPSAQATIHRPPAAPEPARDPAVTPPVDGTPEKPRSDRPKREFF